MYELFCSFLLLSSTNIPPVDGCLDGFQFLANTDKVAINICVQKKNSRTLQALPIKYKENMVLSSKYNGT